MRVVATTDRGYRLSVSMVLELESIVAIVVYGLVAWGLAKLAWLLLGETRSGVRTQSRTVDTDSR